MGRSARLGIRAFCRAATVALVAAPASGLAGAVDCIANTTPDCVQALAEHEVFRIEDYDARNWHAEHVAIRRMVLGDYDRAIRFAESASRKQIWPAAMIAKAAEFTAFLGDEAITRALLARLKPRDAYWYRRIPEIEALLTNGYPAPRSPEDDNALRRHLGAAATRSERLARLDAATREAKALHARLTDKSASKGLGAFAYRGGAARLMGIATAMIVLGQPGAPDMLDRADQLERQARKLHQQRSAGLCIGSDCDVSEPSTPVTFLKALAADPDDIATADRAMKGATTTKRFTILADLVRWQLALDRRAAADSTLDHMTATLAAATSGAGDNWFPLGKVIRLLQSAGRSQDAAGLVDRLHASWTAGRGNGPAAPRNQVSGILAAGFHLTGRNGKAWTVATAGSHDWPAVTGDLIAWKISRGEAGEVLVRVLDLPTPEQRAKWLDTLALYLLRARYGR